MIFTYNKDTKQISVCNETNFKAQNIFERDDIEKWVEENPDILGEKLLIISTEYDKFDKTNERLDLLAIDYECNLVVVELKRDNSGKNVDLQAIKYAAYCSTLTSEKIYQLYSDYLTRKSTKEVTKEEAMEKIYDFLDNRELTEFSDRPRIIIVSKEYRPEVTASVLWLRKFGIDITCVKLTPYDMKNDTLVFESTVLIPLPEAKDYIIQAEHKDNVINAITKDKEEYRSFFDELAQRLINNLSDKYRESLQYPAPKPRNLYQIQTGIGGVHYEWWFHGRPRNSLGVELHFERNDRKFNEDIIKKLHSQIKSIEKETKEEVIVQIDWGKTWSRFYVEKAGGEMTEELKEWAVNNMKVFIETLQEKFDEMT